MFIVWTLSYLATFLLGIIAYHVNLSRILKKRHETAVERVMTMLDDRPTPAEDPETTTPGPILTDKPGPNPFTS